MPKDLPPRLPVAAPVLALCLVLSGCATLPQVPGVARMAPGAAPGLIPVDEILVQADSLRPEAVATAGVQSRAAALRARAARMRGQ